LRFHNAGEVLTGQKEKATAKPEESLKRRNTSVKGKVRVSACWGGPRDL